MLEAQRAPEAFSGVKRSDGALFPASPPSVSALLALALALALHLSRSTDLLLSLLSSPRCDSHLLLFCRFSSSPLPFIVSVFLPPAIPLLPASPPAFGLPCSPHCRGVAGAAVVSGGPSICHRRARPASTTSLPLLAIIWGWHRARKQPPAPPRGSGPAPLRLPPWRTSWCRAQDVTTCKGHTHSGEDGLLYEWH